MNALTKADISEAYSISCVERYVLAYLKKMGINISMLYCNSYLSVDHLISDFLKKNASYINYNAMERIQDIAKEFEIITIEGKSDFDLDFLCRKDFEYVLEMNPDAFRRMYDKETWRDDHFFYAKKNADDTYLYLNDIPLQEKTIDVTELRMIYHHRYIAFRCINDRIESDRAVRRFCNQYEREQLFVKSAVEYMKYENLRDLICMLRISRKRTSDFIEQWEEPNPEWVNHVNNVFSKVEYARVRKRYHSEVFFNEIDAFRQDEKEIGMCLQKIKAFSY